MSTFEPFEDEDALLAILSQISIMGGMTKPQRTIMLHCFEMARFSKGEPVFVKGSEPTHIYVVESGCLKLVVTDDDGREVKSKDLHVGECFGEASLMSMHRHSASVIAMTDSQVLGLSRHTLINLQHQDLGLFALLMMNIARELARRLKFTDDVLCHYLQSRQYSGQKDPSPGSAIPGSHSTVP